MSTGPLSVDTATNEPEPIGAVDGLEGARRRRIAQKHLRWILPIVAVVVALGISSLLYWTQPVAEEADPVVELPLVRVQTAVPATVRMNVTAHGTVTPRTESDVVAEVRGRIVQISPSLVAGGFFSEGDELLRLDDREARIAVDRARAQVRLRTSESKLASAEAARRQELSKQGAVSASNLEQFESRAQVASASLAEARAQLAQAQLDLERTVMRAPFDGRVRERQVDVGQFVNPGTKLGRIYAVDYAEVRLPIATEDLIHLDLGLTSQGSWGSESEGTEAAGVVGAPVLLHASLGGADLTWKARLVRTEGEIDLKTRTLHVVARVDDPYGRQAPVAVPLPSGLFVEAQIEGREREGLFTLPAMAVRDGDSVYVVDGEDRLRVRSVDVVRRGRDEIVVAGGVEAGDRLIVSPLRAVSEGMQVRVSSDAKGSEPADSAEADAS